MRGVVDIFDAVKKFLDEKLVQKVNAVFEFHLTGKEAGVWYLDLKSSTGKHLNLLHCVNERRDWAGDKKIASEKKTVLKIRVNKLC